MHISYSQCSDFINFAFQDAFLPSNIKKGVLINMPDGTIRIGTFEGYVPQAGDLYYSGDNVGELIGGATGGGAHAAIPKFNDENIYLYAFNGQTSVAYPYLRSNKIKRTVGLKHIVLELYTQSTVDTSCTINTNISAAFTFNKAYLEENNHVIKIAVTSLDATIDYFNINFSTPYYAEMGKWHTAHLYLKRLSLI